MDAILPDTCLRRTSLIPRTRALPGIGFKGRIKNFAALLVTARKAAAAEREDLEVDLGQSVPGHAESLRCAIRKVDDTPFLRNVAAVGNAHDDGAVIRQVHNPNDRAEGQRWMAGGHGIHVEDLAAGRRASIEDASIPGGNAVDLAAPPPCRAGWAIGGSRRLGISQRSRGRVSDATCVRSAPRPGKDGVRLHCPRRKQRQKRHQGRGRYSRREVYP